MKTNNIIPENETMFQAIRDAVDACYDEFRPKVKSEKERFSF